MDIKVPHMAEGVESGTIVSVLVAEGDQVTKDQGLVEIETSKAVAPIPSPTAGRVTKVLVKEGDEVPVGRTIITLQAEGDGKGGKTAVKEAPQPKRVAGAPARPAATEVEQAKEAQSGEAEAPLSEETSAAHGGLPPAASPSIRKLAHQLGIDLRHVRGSERGGRITMDDLKAYLVRLQAFAFQKPSAAPAQEKPKPLKIDFSKWGPVTRKKLSSLRRTIGEHMRESWTSVPHVTQFDDADITQIMEFRKKYAAAYEKKGGRLTVSSFAAKAVAGALKQFPVFNTSLDELSGELVYKEYIHIGIAVDTEAGLIVPVVRDADKKTLLELSIEIDRLAEKTRTRKVSLEELQGASFSISNLGSIGGGHFSPIVNKPEVAILGLGRGRWKPVASADGKKTDVRLILPVALSYDHRVIDGADGARFIRAFVEALEKIPESEIKV